MSEYHATAKVSSKMQISLPQIIQEKLGVKEGDYILFYEDKKRIYIDIGEIKPIER